MRPKIDLLRLRGTLSIKKDTKMWLSTLLNLIGRYLRFRRAMLKLGRLDERTLRDIGLSRGEIHREAWKAAAQ